MIIWLQMQDRPAQGTHFIIAGHDLSQTEYSGLVELLVEEQQ